MPRVVFRDEAECCLFVRLVLVSLETGGWLAAAHRGGAAQLCHLAVCFACNEAWEEILRLRVKRQQAAERCARLRGRLWRGARR